MKATGEELKQIEQWHEAISRIPGVERVSITPNYVEALFCPLVDIIRDDSGDTTDKVRQYYTENIYEHGAGFGVRGISTSQWQFMNQHVNGTDILDFFVGSHHIEQAAVASHDTWRNAKEQARLDTDDPYQGYGPQRRKVRDLSAEERHGLDIRDDADNDKDVYHPYDVPFFDLTPDVQHKNVVPMAAACLAIADFLIDDNARLDDLDRVVDKLADRPENQTRLNKLVHTAWMATDITSGGRPWTGAAENYHVYGRLTPAVQNLDARAAEAPLDYIRDKVGPLREASHTLQDTLLRYDGPFGKWWLPESSMLDAVQASGEDMVEQAARHARVNGRIHPQVMRRLWPQLVADALSNGTVQQNSDGLRLTGSGQQRLNELNDVEFLSWDIVSFVANYDDIKNQHAGC